MNKFKYFTQGVNSILEGGYKNLSHGTSAGIAFAPLALIVGLLSPKALNLLQSMITSLPVLNCPRPSSQLSSPIFLPMLVHLSLGALFSQNLPELILLCSPDGTDLWGSTRPIRPQKVDDKIIEVVAHKGSIHLIQIKAGAVRLSKDAHPAGSPISSLCPSCRSVEIYSSRTGTKSQVPDESYPPNAT